MDSKIFALIIIAMVFGFALMERRYKSRLAKEKMHTDSRKTETDREFHDLKKRVETLEKIVTDKGTRLREEIDAL